MSLQKAYGNMYDWVTHMWNCVLGECPHKCCYCYVKKNRFIQNNPMYKGEQRYNSKDENINLGSGKIIFVAHTNDLFTASEAVVSKVLKKCDEYPRNQYVFQTKDPFNATLHFESLPENSIIGTTIETDIDSIINMESHGAASESRLKNILWLKDHGLKTFITIEPIMRFSPAFAHKIAEAKPDWVNIGADSKHSNLPEPTKQEIEIFIGELNRLGVQIKKKENLGRLF